MQFSPDTSPDDLFGAYDIEKFKKGEIYHNIEGSIITNNFAFLDEFMDGSDKLLRSLLNVLLERRFISGTQEEQAILHSAIATSNYMRMSETTEALLDRFLYKSFITPAKDMFTLLKIDKVYNDNAGLVIEPNKDLLVDVRELFVLKEIIRNKRPGFKITIPIEMNYLKNLVVVAFEEEMKKYRDNFYISPRTITKSNDLLKANALLEGRNTVNKNDVEKLYYLFCTLNEPLDNDRTLLSQELFQKVFQKRYQYFESVKNELVPLLYIFEFMAQAQKDLSILKNSISFIDDLAKHSIVSDLFERLKHPFSSNNEQTGFLNKSHLLEYIKTIKSSYSDINEFRDRIETYIKEVFSSVE
jgi:MoxR-like ATPase